jgi:hypothetical protein
LPAWLQRRRGITTGAVAQLNHFFPPLALLLVLVPIFKLAELSFMVWPFILLVDLLAIALAVLTATLLPVLAVLLLTLAATGALIFKIPSDLTGLPASFFLLGAFAVFFVIASVWLVRRFKPDIFKTGLIKPLTTSRPKPWPRLLPASSIVLPFLLLIMATLRLPIANPSPVFGLALLLVVLLLGLVTKFSHSTGCRWLASSACRARMCLAFQPLRSLANPNPFRQQRCSAGIWSSSPSLPCSRSCS